MTACNTLKQVLALSSHKSTVRYQLTNKLLIQRALEPLAHLLLVDYLYDTLRTLIVALTERVLILICSTRFLCANIARTSHNLVASTRR